MKSEGGVVREGAIIKDGKFQAHSAGQIQDRGPRQKVVGKRKQKGFDGEDEEIELTEEMFPERYNTKTELRRRSNRAPTRSKLDLKSKK